MRVLVTVLVDVPSGWDVVGAKERLVSDLERYGDSRVVRVREMGPGAGEQLGLFPGGAKRRE